MRKNRATLGPISGSPDSYAARLNFDLADVIPFGVRNFKGIVNNARNAFGSSSEETSADAPSSYDSVAPSPAFSGPRGGSPMGVDPYDPLSGERYEREKQRIEDVFAARRAMEKEANQPGGSPAYVSVPGARVDGSNTSIGGLNFNTLGLDGPTTETNSGLLQDQILGSSELYDDNWGVTDGELDELVWNPEMGRYVLASNGLPNPRNTADYLGAITPGGGGTVPPARPTDGSAPALPSAAAPALQRYSQERRDLQAKINQGVRDRFKENSSTFADQAADDFYLSAGLTKAGRTPMTDAMRKRMAMQQLAGF